MLPKKKSFPTGARTRVTRVTGGYTNHYTMENHAFMVDTQKPDACSSNFWEKVVTLGLEPRAFALSERRSTD